MGTSFIPLCTIIAVLIIAFLFASLPQVNHKTRYRVLYPKSQHIDTEVIAILNCKTHHFALQNAPFWNAKRTILECTAICCVCWRLNSRPQEACGWDFPWHPVPPIPCLSSSHSVRPPTACCWHSRRLSAPLLSPLPRRCSAWQSLPSGR